MADVVVFGFLFNRRGIKLTSAVAVQLQYQREHQPHLCSQCSWIRALKVPQLTEETADLNINRIGNTGNAFRASFFRYVRSCDLELCNSDVTFVKDPILFIGSLVGTKPLFVVCSVFVLALQKVQDDAMPFQSPVQRLP